MLQTRLFLSCDGDGCEATFPRVEHMPEAARPDVLPLSGTAVVDGAFFTPALLRVEAALVARWLRVKGHDYCPDCAFLYRLQSDAKKGGR